MGKTKYYGVHIEFQERDQFIYEVNEKYSVLKNNKAKLKIMIH